MSKPLHVGLLTPSFAGVTGVGSGIGVHFRHLADGLLEAGHRVTAVVPLEVGKSALGTRPEVKVVPVATPALARLAGRLHWQLHQWCCERALRQAAARAALAVRDVDIWETTSTGAPAVDLLRHRGRPPVVTRVSTTASQLRATNAGKESWLSRGHEKRETRAILGSEAVITHSQSHREHVAREFHLDAARIPIIPHGIPLPPRRSSLAREQVELLYVGRLERRKGIDLLLQALPQVLAAHPKARMTFAGLDAGGFWEAQWRAGMPPGADRVVFAGATSDAELTRLYAQADVLVAPSRYESFGLIFVEGMAWELPVVALNAPGANEVLVDGETALLAVPEDPAALAAALSAVVGSATLRRRLATAGRARAEKLFSRTAMAEASAAFYASVIGTPRVA